MYEALGIVNFENSDVTVGGLTDYRLIPWTFPYD